MRGFTLRAVPVCVVVFACGCFLLPQNPSGTGTAPPATPTHAYWRQVNAIFAQKPVSGELPALLEMVRTQTDQLRELPTDGVDADLLKGVDAVVKAEDEVLRCAEAAGNDPERLKRSEGLARVFADANRAAADSKKKVRALQPVLNARHGGGF